jgi:hypothetical protein
MALTLTADIFAAIQAEGDQVGDIGQGLHFQLDKPPLQRSMVAGVGDYQVSKIFADTRTLAASTGEDLDLSGTTLLDPVGGPIAFTAVKAIYVKASINNTNNVQVKPGAATGFIGPFNAVADQVTLRPGDVFMATAQKIGWTVGAGTTDLFHIHNAGAGTPVDYDIVILGI